MNSSFVGQVPFFGNTPDDTHCVQASIRSILKYFLPERDFSWNELDTMSAKAKDKATWPAQMLMSLADMGFAIDLIESFDADAFIQEGEAYLRRAFGDETADWQVANSDIAVEQQRYQQLLKSGVGYQQRVPTIQDIRDYLAQGYLVKCTLNAKQLNSQPGYNGHSVVVLEVEGNQVTFHDPGLPHQENRTETTERFEAAWASPTPEHKEMIAIKYKG